MTETDFFSDPEVIADPRPYFDRMRSRGPVLREPHHGTLMVTGFDEAMEILNSRDGTYSSACSVVGPIPPLPFRPVGSDIRAQLEAHRSELPWSQHLACFDGRKHADHRSLLRGLRGDLMSELVHSRFRDGSRPDFDALSNLARFLFGAGQDTTSRLIAMAVRIPGDEPRLQRRLRDDPGRIADFIEEVLRYDPPVKVAYRLAVVDTAIGGIGVPAGTLVTVCLSGANNDPGHHRNPDRFDIDRPDLREHMAFGRGVHGCPGAPLGRMEARIAIERLLARTSEIGISEKHHGPPDARRYRFEPTYTFRSLSDLHIEFSSA